MGNFIIVRIVGARNLATFERLKVECPSHNLNESIPSILVVDVGGARPDMAPVLVYQLRSKDAIDRVIRSGELVNMASLQVLPV